MKIGDTYENREGEVHRIIRISPTAALITATNMNTNKNSIFRYYNASGKYIKEHTPSTDLGDFIYNIIE